MSNMGEAVKNESNNSVAILDRVMKQAGRALTPDAAHSLLKLRFPKPDVARMNVLADKARLGSLEAAERREAEEYNLVGHLITLLQSRARRSLQRGTKRTAS